MSTNYKTEETQTLNAILEYLAAVHILAFRQNTGAMMIDNRYVKFGVKGMADILAFVRVNKQFEATDQFWHPIPFWIECKAEKGKQSKFQKSFQELVESHGCRYIIARSIDDVKEALK